MNESHLHIYQHSGKLHIIQHSHCGLFLDMGLGKTVTTLTAVNYLIYEDLAISTVLIVAPKRVAESVWSAEIEKWEHLKHLKIAKILGNEKQRKAAINSKADIYIISRDNIAWLVGQFGGSMLPYDMLVVDESSSFKNPKAIRFKALKQAQPSFKRVVMLTGTPAPNGLIDLWPQIYLLDRGKRLGKTITAYREAYFRPDKRNGAIIFNYKLQDNSEQEIHKQIEDICMSMKAKDCLDLPERINNYIELPFDEDTQKKYDEFEASQVLELFGNGEEISAVNAAALSNKLLQFANGAVYDEVKNHHVVHNLKIEALEEILENANGKPVLVAWTYQSDKFRIHEALKKYKPRDLKSDQDIKDWNSGKIQLMLMHPASGGHGLNLQAGGNIIVWFGQTWSLELYQQFNARLDRQGQTESVVVNHLIAKGTIDAEVIQALDRKDKKQEGLMQAIKAKIEKYFKK